MPLGLIRIAGKGLAGTSEVCFVAGSLETFKGYFGSTKIVFVDVVAGADAFNGPWRSIRIVLNCFVGLDLHKILGLAKILGCKDITDWGTIIRSEAPSSGVSVFISVLILFTSIFQSVAKILVVPKAA